MAGAGVKPGTIYGATDEFGYHAEEDRMHIHDLHATLLHILGLDHTKLTFHFGGRDFRLTDVHGNVAAILSVGARPRAPTEPLTVRERLHRDRDHLLAARSNPCYPWPVDFDNSISQQTSSV